MAAEDNNYKQIIPWIKSILQTDQCKITIEGTSEETNGFIGDIIFVKVSLLRESKELNLAVKAGKTDPEVRKQISIRNACEREIYFYSKIMPFFNNFQSEKKVRDPFDAFPKCYGTFLDEQHEVIVLDNLRKQGFEHHKASEPLNANHIRMGLKNLAKFHALSFAIREQIRCEFDDLTGDLQYPFRPKNKETYLKAGTKIIEQLYKTRRDDLALAYKQLVEQGLEKIILEVLEDCPEEKVVVHCDCHNNNILFRYQDETRKNPFDMMILDFQVTSLHSPAVDLSYFLYMGASTGELNHFVELMEYYHNELSAMMQQLGSDVNKVFPMSTLWQHWKKYSRFGFVMATLSLEVFYLNNEDALLIRTNKGKSVLENLSLLPNNSEAFIERLTAVVDHYVNFQSDL